MICPQCQADSLRVIDSRDTAGEPAIRRRRECESCSYRFTTYERIEAPQLWVVKKDGRREAFDREKLARGVWRACEKRPVSEARIESLVNAVESDIRNTGEPEIPAGEVGETVMRHLKGLDEIAYIRFASVYRQFADLGELARAVTDLRVSRRITRKKPQNKRETVKTNT